MIKSKKKAQTKYFKKQQNLTFSPRLKNKIRFGDIRRQDPKTQALSSLKLGEVYSFKVTALGPNNLGIDEFSYGRSVFLPNTQLGDIVKAKIVKICNQKYKYAIGQVINNQTKLSGRAVTKEKLNYKVGDILEVKIAKLGVNNTGLAFLTKNYFLVIPNCSLGETIKVQITRLKSKFAFGKKILTLGTKVKSNSATPNNTGSWSGAASYELSFDNTQDFQASLQKRILNYTSDNLTWSESAPSRLTSFQNFGMSGSFSDGTLQTRKIKEGSKIQLMLPLNIKRLATHFLLKIRGMVFFVKPTLGAKPGTTVKIKCLKLINYKNQTKFGIAKIIQVNPLSSLKKRSLVRGTLRQMLQSGMHFGEKAVKCDARMKKYIWVNKKGRSIGQTKNKPLVKKGRHLINLLKTRRCLQKTLTVLSKYALKGRPFLFVGTKKSAASLISRASLFSKTSFFVNTRWLGGLLTNWKSILKSISKIRPILKQKQKIIKKILEKRKTIKTRLFQKAIVFRKKSKLLIKKGRAIVTLLKNDKNKNLFKKSSVSLNTKREQILKKAQMLLEKRQLLLQKRYDVLKQCLVLKQKGIFVEKKYKALLNQYISNQQKLREFYTLLMISKEIAKIQKNSSSGSATKIGMVSLTALRALLSTKSESPIVQGRSATTTVKGILPDPPKDVLKKIVLLLNPDNNKNSKISTTSKLKNSTSESGVKIEKVLILSKLLSQFSNYAPILRNKIKIQLEKNKQLEQKFTSLKQTLNLIKTKITYYISLKDQFTNELKKIKTTLVAERQIARLLKRKMRQIIAQKRLIKFLPKLRYLPTPQVKITETVKYLMKNIVDPKLKYPIEMIYDEKVKNQSKKIAAARKKKWERLEKYFGGIAKMTKMNKMQISKMIAIIIGQQEELNAVRECQKFGIKMIHIVDTNCNPNLADYFVPANDDSINSIRFVLTSFLKHIRLAQKLRLRVKKLRKKPILK